MGIVKKSSRLSGTVFGTFNVSYDPEEFEVRSEGAADVLRLVPDCRVFIFGADVTKDIKSVSVDMGLNGNTCSISLANPRGRYEISRSDLMKNWREDKDILAAYDYEEYNKYSENNYNFIVGQLANSVLGSGGAAQVKEGMNLAKSLVGGKSATPRVKGVTRMVFETKHYSGITRRAGDLVFDYRDPVYVFFKGRFSPYWYFGFSGVITGYDDEDVYEGEQTIRLKCADPLELWRRSKLTTRAAFFQNARFEDSLVTTSATSRTNYMSDYAAMHSLADLVKVVAFSYDYGLYTENCHLTSIGRYDVNQPIIDLSQQTIYNQNLPILQSKAKIDKKFMNTVTNEYSGRGSNDYGQINISDIQYGGFKGQLNSLKFSPRKNLYLQLNEIEFPKFTGETIKPFLDFSVRYWESDHKLANGGGSTSSDGTGWVDNKAFGVAGTHPAMKYEFLDNFNILERVWAQCYAGRSQLDSALTSPMDKILESVVGSPVEEAGSASSGETPVDTRLGSNINLFRPRLFLLLPQKYANRLRRAEGGTFAQLGKLFQDESTTTLESLRSKMKSIEYIVYSSAMGDIFLEPELYDCHPLEFCDKIEKKDIVLKKENIKFRIASSEYKNRLYAKLDKAYMFNTSVNHPFFIMEKDRYRTTQTFTNDSVYTSVNVKGSQTDIGGVLEIVNEEMTRAVTALSQNTRASGNNTFREGWYIADGLENYRKKATSNATTELLKNIEEITKALNRMALMLLVQNYKTLTIKELVVKYVSALYDADALLEGGWLDRQEFSVMVAISNNIGVVDTSNTEATAEKLVAISPFSDSATSTVEAYFTVLEGNTAPRRQRNRVNSDSGRSQNEGSVSKVFGQLVDSVLEYMDAGTNTNIISNNNFENITLKIKWLIKFILPVAVVENQAIQEYYKSLVALKKEAIVVDDLFTLTTEGQIFATLGDLKKLEKLQLYNPRLDMVQRYGYNPFPKCTNPYIRNGEEADRYAKVIFNRMYGKAFTLSIDMVGRPEFMLNRTYYCERKDAIGLLDGYSINFDVESDFRSTAKLSYVRKNSLTYAYSQGDLDEIVGDKNNAYFTEEADTYYKWNKVLNQSTSLIGRGVSNLVSGGNNTGGRALGGDIAGKMVGKALSGSAPVGGLFSAHDEIGHLEFDYRGVEATTQDLSLSRMSSIGQVHRLVPELQAISLYIKESLEMIKSIDEWVETNKNDITVKEAELRGIADVISEINNNPAMDTPTQRRLGLQKTVAIFTQQNLNSEIDALYDLNTSYTAHKLVHLKKLYGSSYTDNDHPSNPDSYVKNIVQNQNLSEITAASAKSGNSGSRGFYEVLLANHLLAYPTDNFTNVTVTIETTTTNPDISSDIPYFIVRGG
jgi:hypothetical protein